MEFQSLKWVFDQKNFRELCLKVQLQCMEPDVCNIIRLIVCAVEILFIGCMYLCMCVCVHSLCVFLILPVGLHK
jgi:hypothetical protein